MKALACLLALLFVFGFLPTNPAADSADLVLINGNIYTVNEKQPHAEAIAVKGDRIVFVGSNAGAKVSRREDPRDRFARRDGSARHD